MKFSEYVKEEQEVNLIGKKINGRLITKTPIENWDGLFNCLELGLTSLKGAPEEVSGNFSCAKNKLKTLKNGPKIVGGSFICFDNDLISLEGAPKTVNKSFYCNDNKLTSLEFMPAELGGDFNCSRNKIRSFKDIHKIITKMKGKFWCVDTPIKSHVLGLLLIPGISDVFGHHLWSDIVNKHLSKGRKGLLDCQNELIEVGLEEYAQL